MRRAGFPSELQPGFVSCTDQSGPPDEAARRLPPGLRQPALSYIFRTSRLRKVAGASARFANLSAKRVTVGFLEFSIASSYESNSTIVT
jgi:hypothetical protein